MKKVTYVFVKKSLTVYPSIAAAEKDLGVKALRRTLQQHEGVTYVNDALVIRPVNEYDYKFLNMMIEGLSSF